ncbi:MAG: hypothetical protein GY903_20625 [Fuerstiella sp.]|jgi:hypothetical protein|nr:hypothetical protein [Fuerstiella sp.]MCP4856894.1 hypothetical protein [Fuerstiella sp.]
MTITSFASPATLQWSHFTPVPNRPRDPHDNTEVDALTMYDYLLPARAARRVGSLFALNDSLVLLITPNCRVWRNCPRTPALLAHEQFHYDVGIVVARAAVRHFSALRASTSAALGTALAAATRLHFSTRNNLIQRRYDIDTRHGTNSHYQRIWKNRMATCLANPSADQIGGYFL